MKNRRCGRSLWFASSFTILLASFITVEGQEFTHTTTTANTISSRSTIFAPGLADNPQAIIVATPTAEALRANPHPLGVWYYNNKWNIFNTDHAVMPTGLVYKLRVFANPDSNQFLHVVTRQNLSEAASYIDNPAINNKPNAQVIVLQNHAPENRAYNLNANEARASYNAASGKWYIANVNGKTLYPNTAYNVVVAGGVPDDSVRPLDPRAPQVQPLPTRTREPMPVQPIPTRTRERMEVEPVRTATPAAPGASSNQLAATASCTKEQAWQTVGKWAPQRKAEVVMADRSFPKAQYKPLLAKAQKAINLFMQANPQFNGIEAWAYSGIRGESIIPNGPVPFRADISYGSYICIGNSTYKVDMRGKIIVYGNYGVTTVAFNGLSDVLESSGDTGLTTTSGEKVFQYDKDLGELRGFPLIRPSNRDSDHEAMIITPNGRLPYKPITQEQYLRARIRMHESGGGMGNVIAGVNRVLENMSPAERSAPALVRDISALPGSSRLFATEAEGGRHLVTIDKSYFDPKLPRETIQLITVHWHSTQTDRPKVEMIAAFKKDFDFIALWEMLGK